MKNSWLQGTAWLMLAGLTGKILSAGYRIPLQNLGGDIGFYVYQQIYPIVGIGIIFALQGVPAAVSRVVAENRKLTAASFYLPVFLCLSVFFWLLAGAGFVSAASLAGLMDDWNLISSLKASFLVFLFVPFLALLRGAFQGEEDMKTPAVSQILEQFLRVAGILIVSTIVYVTGSVYFIGTGTAAAVITGMVAATGYLFVKWKKRELQEQLPAAVSSFPYVKQVLFYSVLISVNYMMLLLLQLTDAFTFVPLLLEDHGISVTEAREWKGIYDRAQPLIQLVTVLASSLALSILPAIVRSEQSVEPVRQAMALTLVISTAASVGLLLLFPEINRLFFQDESGTGVLRVQMVMVILVSLALTAASALQGLGYAAWTAALIGGGLIVKAGLNVVLIPEFGTYGAAVASVAAVSVAASGNLFLLKKKLNSRLFTWKWGRMLPALAGMSLFVLALKWLYIPEGRLLLLPWVLAASGGGAIVYALLLRQFRVLPAEALPAQFRKWFIKENG
ncbi:putative polysaccharide biosynthesis protein [Salimicrobium album]|uniref:Polysaccharide transporter, PST family n=1 Tax=Salimicrobium album TaxID=50717 RepID=A0A1H3J8C0_9BACI|nr:polysaccharide biosynthesis protein [Salimicrobium album]SDY36152.1 polysaccharide transporter, PST family [Salimicrobium album]